HSRRKAGCRHPRRAHTLATGRRGGYLRKSAACMTVVAAVTGALAASPRARADSAGAGEGLATLIEHVGFVLAGACAVTTIAAGSYGIYEHSRPALLPAAAATGSYVCGGILALFGIGS